MDEAESTRRRNAIQSIFNAWDLDGNGEVGFGELTQILHSAQMMSNKEAMKWVRKMEAQIQQARNTNQVHGSQRSLQLHGGGYVNFSEVDGEPSLDPEAFESFIFSMTSKDTQEEFDRFIVTADLVVRDAAEATHGSKLKRDVWEMFQLLDINSDGFVDMKELEMLLVVEHRDDRKLLTKWKHQLRNKCSSGRLITGRSPESEPIQPAADASAPQPAAPRSTRASIVAVDGPEPPEAAVEQDMKLSLRDFQLFLKEYVEGKEERVPAILAAVRKAVQEKHIEYILKFRVHDIINEVMDDLLRERPVDVLEGIKRSVCRLQRTNKYPKPIVSKRKQSKAT